MEQPIPFGEILEAVEALSPDEQETLVDIVERRLADRARQRLAEDIREARAEFAQGYCQPASVESLMDEILSRNERSFGPALLAGPPSSFSRNIPYWQRIFRQP